MLWKANCVRSAHQRRYRSDDKGAIVSENKCHNKSPHGTFAGAAALLTTETERFDVKLEMKTSVLDTLTRK